MYDLQKYDGQKATTILTSSNGSGTFDFKYCQGSKGQQWLISGGRDGKIRLWDIKATNTPRRTMNVQDNSIIYSIDTSYDNELIFSANERGIIHIWDIRQSDYVLYQLDLFDLFTNYYKSLNINNISITKYCINNIQLYPYNDNYIAFQLAGSYAIGIIDILSKKLISLHTPMITGKLLYSYVQIEIIVFIEMMEDHGFRTTISFTKDSYIASGMLDNNLHIITTP